MTTTNDTKVYGVDGASAVAGDYTITGYMPAVAGAYLADTRASATSGAASVTSTGSAVTAGVQAGGYQISAARLRPGQVLMHPGPVNRGVELSADAIDSPLALIGEQVKAGVAVRMAVLYEVLVGTPMLAAVA